MKNNKNKEIWVKRYTKTMPIVFGLSIIYYFIYYFNRHLTSIKGIEFLNNLKYAFPFVIQYSITIIIYINIIIGLIAIIIIFCTRKYKFKALISTVLLLVNNLFFWKKIIINSKEILQNFTLLRQSTLENAIEVTGFFILFMLSILVVLFSNVLLYKFLINSDNIILDDQEKNDDLDISFFRKVVVFLPIPLYFSVYWIAFENGWIDILKFIRNI
ncbi:TPA: hypothetical protein P6V55_000081 [Staphylococcus aureus]|nr:hypothetical protein [Staphylococcus aureus]HDD0313469.1 hypothetical protein [Staphylococcus aureus]HDD0710592.1 hypothetical protein [Staphylococcus aureus]HDP5915517.1 hypothetical protein [Staphylococcus aureus]HDP5921396.1 hypothetical protein [Staphylococcus aureus]